MARLESFDCFCYLQLEVRAVRGGLQGVSAYAAIHNIVAQKVSPNIIPPGAAVGLIWTRWLQTDRCFIGPEI